MRKAILMVMGLLVVGCATTEAVKLRHPATGKTVVCGPYGAERAGPQWAAIAEMKLRGCIEDYQRQGYQRAPE